MSCRFLSGWWALTRMIAVWFSLSLSWDITVRSEELALAEIPVQANPEVNRAVEVYCMLHGACTFPHVPPADTRAPTHVTEREHGNHVCDTSSSLWVSLHTCNVSLGRSKQETLSGTSDC